jgi:hypothetical protein
VFTGSGDERTSAHQGYAGDNSDRTWQIEEVYSCSGLGTPGRETVDDCGGLEPVEGFI